MEATTRTDPGKTITAMPVIGIKPEPEICCEETCCEDRTSRVAIAAYFKAEARGFEPGHEMEDWLAAEAEVQQ